VASLMIRRLQAATAVFPPMTASAIRAGACVFVRPSLVVTDTTNYVGKCRLYIRVACAPSSSKRNALLLLYIHTCICSSRFIIRTIDIDIARSQMPLFSASVNDALAICTTINCCINIIQLCRLLNVPLAY